MWWLTNEKDWLKRYLELFRKPRSPQRSGTWQPYLFTANGNKYPNKTSQSVLTRSVPAMWLKETVCRCTNFKPFSWLIMNLNVRSQNCRFPFTSLPTLVIYHIAQYLKRRDLENMAQVNRHLRNVFNTPRLWRDVQIRILGKKTDSQSLQILKVRGVTDLEFSNVLFDLPIATLHHCLERLSVHVTWSSTLEVLFNAASNGHLCNLKSLAFGDLDYKIGHKSRVTFLSLFKSLPMMEEVSFGRDSPARFFNRGNYVPLTDEVSIYYITSKLY